MYLLKNIQHLPIHILLSICFLSKTFCGAQTPSFDLYEETFETEIPPWVSSNIDLSIVPGSADGNVPGNILEASYRPASNGSPRLSRVFSFNKVNEATLSFDFKLGDNFEFVKGGKMHGLAGGTATTGCDPIDPSGWSVRMVWRQEGVYQIYVYHQDRQNVCGDSYTVPNFTLSRQTWYHVDLQVRINSAPSVADGAATLYIGGEEMLEVNNLRLTGDESIAIDKFQFSTFYGGSDSTWAPSTTTKIFFDNFIVNTHNSPAPTPVASLSPSTSLCTGGVLSPDRWYCCLASCGSCGGTGCGARPGGGSNCCTGSINNSGRVCGIDGVLEPPCKIPEPGTTSSPTISSTPMPVVPSTPTPVQTTPTPVSTTPAPVDNPTPCADRTQLWKIGRKTRNWCRWLNSRKVDDIAAACTGKNLYADCPVTCDACDFTPAPVPSTTPAPISSSCTDRTGQWKIGRKTRNWCAWLNSKKVDDIPTTCARRNLIDDCPQTCDKDGCAP